MTLRGTASGGDVPPKLIGRNDEVDSICGTIDAIPDRGTALIVRGDAGIGKSVLLRAAQRRAISRGFEVLTATAVQSEVDMPFAALHQLLMPLAGTLDRLPATSRQAIEAAFGISDAATPSTFLIALATLQLLGEQGELVILVDDAQWLDASSADVLAFVARRLEHDPVALLFALRDGFDSVILRAGLPELTVGALGATAAAELLDARAPSVQPGVRARILHDAAGNPLALVELAIAARSAGIDYVLPLAPLPLTARLQRLFADRFAALSFEARQFLLVVAADESGNLADIMRASATLSARDDSPGVVSEAEAAGLVDVDGGSIRFRHPLMRSAIYEAAKLVERQAAHSALASVVADDADRRAWHLAAGVIGTDDEVGDALEAAAQRVQGRGGYSVALRMMDRAARVTSDASTRARRILAAAWIAQYVGRMDDAARILAELKEADLPAPERADVALLREFVVRAPWSGATTVAASIAASNQLRAAGFYDRALGALATFSLRCFWSNPDAETRARVIEAVERIPLPQDNYDRLTTLALAAPEERGAAVLARLRRIVAEPMQQTQLGGLGVAATGIGDFVSAEHLLDAAVASLRAEGMFGGLARILSSLALTHLHRGNWRLAAFNADEAARMGLETGQPLFACVAKLTVATLNAHQGAIEASEALAAEAERAFIGIGANPMLALVQMARGAACLAAGRPDACYEQLRRIYDKADIAYHPHIRSWVLVDLVEAGIHAGRTAEVRGFVAEQEQYFTRTQSPLLKVHLDVARAWLSPDDDAEGLFRIALDDNPTASPFTRARVHLAYGLWLKRRRRAADSRPHLRTALQTFDALGAAPWSERARRELRASGETSRRAPPSAGWLALSPQELQIAELAAEGSSNKEIARQLFLSHRTVATHLYRIFPKLGITNRSQLHAALGVRSEAD